MTRLLITTLTALLLTTTSWAGKQTSGNVTVNRNISVYDDDTLPCDIAGSTASVLRESERRPGGFLN